ncbi:hypothetical protein SRABI128_05023 [Microbacterium sp. Bi128]|nr:hypothetical protein SRABI128_05023 [Microbacterium sp. Bi128]
MLRPCRNSPLPSPATSSRLSSDSAGSRVPGSCRKRSSAAATPLRSPLPKRPSIGLAYAGTSCGTASMMASTMPGIRGRSMSLTSRGRASQGGS